jgi:hypothetical protein
MKKLLGVLGTIGFVIVLIIAMGVGKMVGRGVSDVALHADSDISLSQISEKVNATLPMMVDSETRLDSTAPGPDRSFNYLYTLVNYPSNALTPSVIEDLAPEVTKKVCTTSQMQRMLASGVTAIFRYRGNDGVEVGRIEINQRDCTAGTAISSTEVEPRQTFDRRNDDELKELISDLVLKHAGAVDPNSIFIYYLPDTDFDHFVEHYNKLSAKVKSDVSRGILPGNVLAYGSPASGQMANMVVDAYVGVPPGSMKGVRVIYVGLPNENARVSAAIAGSGADYVFANLSDSAASTP